MTEVKIISDGTPRNSRVLLSDGSELPPLRPRVFGKELPMVQSVDWSLGLNDVARAVIVVAFVPVEVEANATIYYQCPQCGDRHTHEKETPV